VKKMIQSEAQKYIFRMKLKSNALALEQREGMEKFKATKSSGLR